MKSLYQFVFGNTINEIVDPILVIDEKGKVLDSNSLANEELNISQDNKSDINFYDLVCKNVNLCDKCNIKHGINKICKLGDNQKLYHIEALKLNLRKMAITLLKIKPIEITYDQNSVHADISDGSSIGMLVTESDGTITYFDEQFINISSINSKNLIGKNITSIFPEGKKVFSQYLDKNISIIENQLIQIRCQEGEGNLLQATVLTLSGDTSKYFWFFYSVTPVELFSEQKNNDKLSSTLIESSSMGVMVLSNHKIFFTNEYISKATGYSSVELTAMQFEELFPSRKEYNSLLKELVSNRKKDPNDIYKTLWQKRDKSLIQVALKTATKKHLDLKDTVLIVTNFEEEFDQDLNTYAKNEYEELFMKMTSGFALCEAINEDENAPIDFKYIAVNPRYIQLLDLDNNKLTGKTFREVLPDLEEEWFEKYAAIVSGGQPGLFVNFIEKKRKYYETLVYSHEKNKLAILINDVTQRIKSRNELENIVNLSIDLICIADLEGNLVKTNPSFKNILGFSEADFSNKKIQEFIFQSKSDSEAETLLLDINDEDTVANYQSNYVDSKGNEIWLSWTLQTLSKEKTIFAIGRDITQIKKAEMEFISAKEKAEEGDRLKSAFLANMSHEVRTPMNAIIGFSTLLDNDLLESTKRSKYIQIIKGRCNDLLRIIDDILDISRIEAGQLDIFPEPFYVHEFFNEVMEIYYYRLESMEKTHLTINIMPLAENFQVYNDRQRLLQVINNLLDNAIKFTKEGAITIGCEKYNDSKLMFYVKDTGIGIQEEKFDIIFHRFRQAEENLSRKFGGNGLGLAISKPLVKLMGGELWLESKVGIGSKFYFTIDRIREKKQKEQTSNFVNKNILLVEDDRHSVGYFRIVLEQFGATITHARTGFDAIHIIDQGAKFDIILMDIQLSDMSGLEVTSYIRENDKTTPIIAQTAYAQEADRKTCLNAGCSDYIAKPIDDEDLIAMINKHIRN
jgi:PAS domain S-box-containing protein